MLDAGDKELRDMLDAREIELWDPTLIVERIVEIRNIMQRAEILAEQGAKDLLDNFKDLEKRLCPEASSPSPEAFNSSPEASNSSPSESMNLDDSEQLFLPLFLCTEAPILNVLYIFYKLYKVNYFKILILYFFSK